MAIVIGGKSRCPICGNVIKDGQEIVSFPPFVGNELDPLWFFSDAAFHASCFQEHPLAQEALHRSEELLRHIPPSNRLCVICKREIEEFDDYFSLGHLVADPAHPLFRYNYLQAHRSHLAQWPELSQLSKLIQDLKESGAWRGPALDYILTVLKKAHPQ